MQMHPFLLPLLLQLPAPCSPPSTFLFHSSSVPSSTPSSPSLLPSLLPSLYPSPLPSLLPSLHPCPHRSLGVKVEVRPAAGHVGTTYVEVRLTWRHKLQQRLGQGAGLHGGQAQGGCSKSM